jgi:hypothetical protein
MGSAPQSHKPEVGQVTVHKGVLEVGASSPQAKWKGQAKSSMHRGSQPQAEGTMVLPKLTNGVWVNDDIVSGVTSIKYFDHDVVDVTKFPDFASQFYLERRGVGSSGMPLIEPV